MRGKPLAGVIALVLVLLCASAWAKQGFVGVVEALPPEGYYGLWVISGQPVQVTPETSLKFKKHPPRLGSWVKVDGMSVGGHYYAREIKPKKPKKH